MPYLTNNCIITSKSGSRLDGSLRGSHLHTIALSYTEEVSLEIRYRVVKRAATLATGPRPQKLAADPDS